MDSTKCWLCPSKIKSQTDLFSHPLLKVAVCTSCFDYYNEPNWTCDEAGKSNFCNCCADGGTILPCDNSSCTNAFCFSCLQKFHSKQEYNDLIEMCNQDEVDEEDDVDWLCILCKKPEQLKNAIADLVKARSRLKKLPSSKRSARSERRSGRGVNGNESETEAESTTDVDNKTSGNSDNSEHSDSEGFKFSDDETGVSKSIKRRSKELKKRNKRQKLSTTLNGHENDNGHVNEPESDHQKVNENGHKNGHENGLDNGEETENDSNKENISKSTQKPTKKSKIPDSKTNSDENNLTDTSYHTPATSPTAADTSKNSSNSENTPLVEPDTCFDAPPDALPNASSTPSSPSYEYLSSAESPEQTFIDGIESLPEQYQIFIREKIERNKRLKVINKTNKLKREEHKKMKGEVLERTDTIERGVNGMVLKEEQMNVSKNAKKHANSKISDAKNSDANSSASEKHSIGESVTNTAKLPDEETEPVKHRKKRSKTSKKHKKSRSKEPKSKETVSSDQSDMNFGSDSSSETGASDSDSFSDEIDDNDFAPQRTSTQAPAGANSRSQKKSDSEETGSENVSGEQIEKSSSKSKSSKSKKSLDTKAIDFSTEEDDEVKPPSVEAQASDAESEKQESEAKSTSSEQETMDFASEESSISDITPVRATRSARLQSKREKEDEKSEKKKLIKDKKSAMKVAGYSSHTSDESDIENELGLKSDSDDMNKDLMVTEVEVSEKSELNSDDKRTERKIKKMDKELKRIEKMGNSSDENSGRKRVSLTKSQRDEKKKDSEGKTIDSENVAGSSSDEEVAIEKKKTIKESLKKSRLRDEKEKDDKSTRKSSSKCGSKDKKSNSGSESSEISSKSKTKKLQPIININTSDTSTQQSGDDMPPTPGESDEINSSKIIKNEAKDPNKSSSKSSHPFFKATKSKMRKTRGKNSESSENDSMAEDMKKSSTSKSSKSNKKTEKSKSKKRSKDNSGSEETDSDFEVVKEKKPRRKKGEAFLPSFKKRKPLGRSKKLRKNRKKKGRKIMSRDALREDTKTAIEHEENRQLRIQKLRKELLKEKEAKQKKKEKSDMSDEKDSQNRTISESEDETGMVYLDCQNKIPIDENFASLVKPHQSEGLKFVFDNLYESLPAVQKQIKIYDKMDEDKDNDEALPRHGNGCIIAHCMGLGKTLTSIVFLHTIMNHDVLSSEFVGRTCLVLCPKNVYQNWHDEIIQWCRRCDKTTRFPVHMFPEGSRDKDKNKVSVMKEWRRAGGVLIATYDQFKNHVMLAHDKDLEVQYQEGTKGPKTKKKRHQKKRIYKGYRNDFLSCLLDPGPDIVILDEGHIIKNQDSGVNMTVNLISSQRRLALTGTPMQNNLNEYYWMVNFCKPNLLGTLREYKNQYSETISRGQKLDATNHDVTLMKQYAGLLYTILKDTVHRKDEGILKAMLPKKTEIVVQMRLTSLQEKLYERYMETRGFGLDFITKTDKEMKRLDQDLMSAMRSNMKSGLFSDKLKLENLGFHPGLFKQALLTRTEKEDQYLENDSEGSLVNFIDDEDDEEYSDNSELSGSSTSTSKNSKKGKSKKSKTKNKGSTTPDEKSSETYYLMEKKVEELQIYCKTIFRTDYAKNKIYDKPKLKTAFDQLANVEDISMSSLRRLAYAMHFVKENADNDTFKVPHQFLESLKPGHFKMSPEMVEIKRAEKALQMNELLKGHFTKSLTAEKQRQPTNRELLEAMSNPQVQEHAKNQIKSQMEVLVESHENQESARIEKEQMALIESKIKQDAGVKAKTDALSHFDEGIGYDYDASKIQVDVGCKLFFCMEMMERCEQRGEKLVIATQRMDVLDQLEHCLEQISVRNRKDKNKNKTRVVKGFDSEDETGKPKKIQYKTTNRMGQWKKNIDYFRIDGGVSVDKRMEAVRSFNSKNNQKSRLMLLSTKAGGIGINLIGASRMILADVSFNPANDRQALFRIYRLGQERDCKIYRLVADGTMEHAIFKRQIDKMHLSHRVVDEVHCERQYTENDLKELYRYKPDLKYTESTLVKVSAGLIDNNAENNKNQESLKDEKSSRKAKNSKNKDNDTTGDILNSSQLELVPPADDQMIQSMFANDKIITIIANWRYVDSLMVEEDGQDKLTAEQKQEIWRQHKAKILAGERSQQVYGAYSNNFNTGTSGNIYQRAIPQWPAGMARTYIELFESQGITATTYSQLSFEQQTRLLSQLLELATAAGITLT